MTPSAKAIRAAMSSAARASVVLDFGARPGIGFQLMLELRSAGVHVDWDGATLAISLADVKASGLLVGGS
jgi:hypothetical protein